MDPVTHLLYYAGSPGKLQPLQPSEYGSFLCSAAESLTLHPSGLRGQSVEIISTGAYAAGTGGAEGYNG